MHYLVTGGCGFIGSHLVRKLLSLGHSVTVLDDLSTGKRDSLPATALLTVGDILNQQLVTQLLHRGCDGCFHLAAIPSVERCLTEWPRTSEVNVLGTIIVLEAARTAPIPVPVVYASSAAVYGVGTDHPLQEAMTVAPISSYGVDKLACEDYGRIAWRNYGLPNVGLRFFNVYGPDQPLDSPYSGVISKFIHAQATGNSPLVFGDGEQTRDFIYVGDVVNALIAVMQMPGKSCEVYNVCTGKSVSVNTLLAQIAHIMKSDAKAEYRIARPGDIRHSCGSPDKLFSAVSTPPLTALVEGLHETITAAGAG